MKRIYTLTIIFLLFLFSFVQAAETKKIGILIDGPYWWYDGVLSNFQTELAKLTQGEFELVYDEKDNLNGQYDLSRIASHAKQLAQKGRVDLIFSFGTVSGIELSKITPLEVPVMAIGIDMAEELKLLTPKTYRPVNPNLTTIHDPTVVMSYITLTAKLFSSFDRFTYLCSSFICSNFPVFTERVPTAIKGIELPNGKSVIGQAVFVSPDNYLEKIASLETDVVITGELFGFSEEQVKDLYTQLAARKIPSVTVDGVYGAEQGALAALSDYDFKYMGRKIALKVASILRGTKPSELSVIENYKMEVMLNQETARKVGYDIPLEFYYDAKIVGKAGTKKRLTLEQAGKLALERNWDIVVKLHQQEQAREQTSLAWGGYLPHIESNVNYTKIDNTRADLQPSPRAQTRLELSLFQNIYNRELSKQIELAELGVTATKQESEITEQDVLQAVALMYINYLMAEDIVEIRRKQLRILRKHREIAQLRFDLEETGKSDVIRLDIQYDQGLVDLVKATESLNQAKAGLINLFNISKETDFDLLDKKKYSKERFLEEFVIFEKYRRTERQLEVFRDFLINATYQNSVELRLLKTRLQQARVDKERIQGKFWPTVNVGVSWFQQLQSEHRDLEKKELPLFGFDETGQPFTQNVLLSDEEDIYEKANKTGWNAQVKLTLPLYSGGTRYKEMNVATSKILELEARRQKLKADLAQGVRVLYYEHYTSRNNTKIAIRDVELAEENLKLAEVAYLQGSMAILDLLDIQNSLFLTEVNATVIRYQSIQTNIKIYRSIGAIGMFFNPDDEKITQQITQALDDYFEKNLPGFRKE